MTDILVSRDNHEVKIPHLIASFLVETNPEVQESPGLIVRGGPFGGGSDACAWQKALCSPGWSTETLRFGDHRV